MAAEPTREPPRTQGLCSRPLSDEGAEEFGKFIFSEAVLDCGSFRKGFQDIREARDDLSVSAP